MFIQIGDFEIYEYDKNNPDQRHLKYVLNNNDDFLKYVTKKIEERLKEGKILPGGGLSIDGSYLVKYKGEFVGYIRLENLRWNGTLDIEWAVSPEFQNQKLGTKIVRTLSEYIFKNYQQVLKIRGIIDKSNYRSKALAKSVGFEEEKKDENYIYVTKSR